MLEQIKKECKEKKNQAERLYKKRSEEAILKDLQDFNEKNPGRLKKSDKGYVLDDNILVRISNGGIEIEDRRATPFLWGFEIECEYSYGDVFVYKGKPEAVEYATDPDMESAIRDVIVGLENSIKYLQSNKIKEYKYISVKPDIELDNIESVFEIVIAREPIYF